MTTGLRLSHTHGSCSSSGYFFWFLHSGFVLLSPETVGRFDLDAECGGRPKNQGVFDNVGRGLNLAACILCFHILTFISFAFSASSVVIYYTLT